MTMKWIRLRETLSGGRADGRPWPVAGEVIDVPDWEYDHCIAAGWAEHADPPEPEPAPEPAPVMSMAATKALQGLDPVPPPEPVSAPAQAQAEVPAGGIVRPSGPGDDVPVVIEPAASQVTVPGPDVSDDAPDPPRPSDSKPDWVAYAVTQGMDADKATAMSKADLMSRYGGRL